MIDNGLGQRQLGRTWRSVPDKSATARPRAPRQLDHVEDFRRCVAGTVRALERGKLKPTVAQAMIAALNALVTVFDTVFARSSARHSTIQPAMPRTVIFAVVCTLSYGVGALVMLARFVSRLADSSDYYALFANLLTAFVLVGTAGISLSQARGLVRRQERARKSAFSTGLIMALVWGVLVLTAVVIGLALRRYAAILEVLALMLAPVAPSVATAWSLSRPSAKAWFASAPPDAQAARR